MKKNAAFENQPIVPNDTLKLTSLIYFKEALDNEDYEECAELIRIAKKFGARKEEIRGVITESNQGLKPIPLNEVKEGQGERFRF